MNILIISQCSKRARQQTCRILDQFAERTGDSAWQTAITQEGLKTLRQLLRKTARRNTAVACHWLKTGGQSELLWIVGNLRHFNAQGRVPTNRTTLDVLRSSSEHHWHSAESIALLAAIAGLFHDFGKSGRCFQDSLTGKSKKRYQPYRHEWISLRLFQAFVTGLTDDEWLDKLGTVAAGDEKKILARLIKDDPEFSDSPFNAMPPVARTVAWLILSHHRLPALKLPPALSSSENWLEKQLVADWNALNHEDPEWKATDFKRVWTFPHGTPLQSSAWRDKAQQIARRVKRVASFKTYGQMDQLFTLHLSRLVLMLADHYYSSLPAQLRWQDAHYPVWANTVRDTGEMKQKLDEHNVGVAHHAYLTAHQLPRLKDEMPAIARHAGFRKPTTNLRFSWQNKAWDTARSMRERSQQQGFFGINMASTGGGKTLANARIMYALADEEKGCRFSIALGLRTLTLQTGRALSARLDLDDDDLAVITGSQAVRELHAEERSQDADTGSASEEALIEENQHVHFEGTLSSGPLQQWLASDTKLNRLVSAPILVSTIDYLIPATEGLRGGKQIAPMLRLLTSDLVLDEPDDFAEADLYALSRLVNWAGMSGARVLLSSATLTPAQVEALFDAYQSGRRAWQQACGEPGISGDICCTWFDEYGSQQSDAPDIDAFKQQHHQFVQRRVRHLAQKTRLHYARLVEVKASSQQAHAVIDGVAETLLEQMMLLHDQHHQTHKDKTVSLGLVRFANINPQVATTLSLLEKSLPDDYCLHYCVYHGRHPLAVRSRIEKRLDSAFDRRDADRLWTLPEVEHVLATHPAKHHLFVVLGTSVIEVGRDWDADWGIIEPSSMRSIIQFAGRIQRHRQIAPLTANLVVLHSNIRALRGFSPAFCQPGSETKTCKLRSHDLRDLLDELTLQRIDAVARISDEVAGNELAALEHLRLQRTLIENDDKQAVVAAEWWRSAITWSGVLQRMTPFRRSQPEQQFYLCMADEEAPAGFALLDASGSLKPAHSFKPYTLVENTQIRPWFEMDYREVLLALAEERQLEIEAVGQRYGEINLPDDGEGYTEDWLYHPQLGVFRAL